MPLAADPPQPAHQGTGLLPLLRTTAGSPAALVKVAGLRWTIEENFQAGKGLTGLDEHQVRRWTSWYRWVTLAMLASAFLSIAAVAEHVRAPAPAGHIPLTRNEIASLFTSLIIRPAHDTCTRCAGPAGGDATSTAPRYAPTSGRQPKGHEDHDLRLEY
jgi:hypothetical protein